MTARVLPARGYGSTIAGAVDGWLVALARLWVSLPSLRRRRQLVLQVSDDGLVVDCREGKAMTRLAAVRGDVTGEALALLRDQLQDFRGPAWSTVLRLGDDHVLQHRLFLPEATRDVLSAVVSNQIERIAPWPLPDMIFAYAVADRSDEPGQIGVNVVTTSRTILDDALAKTRALGLEPSIAIHGTDDDAGQELILYSKVGDEQGRRQTLIGVALAGIMLAAIAAGAVGSYRAIVHDRDLAGIRLQTLEARARLAAANKIDARSAQLKQQVAQIAGRKTSQPASVITLEFLSRALSDDAWLTSLQVRGDTIVLSGYAANAAALISQLARHPYFENVRFSAPTTRGELDQYDRFAISATVLPRPTLGDRP